MTPIDITLSGVGGEYMESAVLVEWRAADGARVTAGDVVAVVETAKAATEIEAPADGVLRILVPAGEEIVVGTVLARLGETVAPVSAVAVQAVPVAPEAGMPRRWPDAYASPLAKRIAAERGIDLRGMHGSGPAGRIVRNDLPAPVPAHLPESGAAGFMIAIEVDASALLAARADHWDTGAHPSVGDLVADAARDALRRQGLGWPVALLDDDAARDALLVLDLTAFGVTAFTPPHLRYRAVLGICAPPAASLLRLSLSADARDLPCMAAARFLATLRGTLETPTVA